MKSGFLTAASALKTHGFIAVGFLLVAIMAGIFTAGPAIAQAVRAALVQNLDEPGRNPFAFSQAFSTSPRAMWNIPAGKRYVAEQFTAECLLDSAYSLTSVQLSSFTNGTPVKVAAVPHFQVAVVQGIYSWIGTGTARLYADPGSTLEIALTTSGGLQVQPGACTFSVSGYIINNP